MRTRTSILLAIALAAALHASETDAPHAVLREGAWVSRGPRNIVGAGADVAVTIKQAADGWTIAYEHTAYRRAKSALEGSKSGWGLGLTLVKGVVDAHHGTVHVESKAGSGTSFILELPFPATTPVT